MSGATSIEECIRAKQMWTQLPRSVRQLLGNSQREYEKMVVEYSIKNQLRHKGNLGAIICCLQLERNIVALLYRMFYERNVR